MKKGKGREKKKKRGKKGKGRKGKETGCFPS